MRTLLVVIVTITLGLLIPARADLTIVQHVEGAGQTGDTTVKIKGDKERIDSPEQPTRILDGKGGQMINLLNDRKAFVKVSAEQLKAATETLNKFEGSDKSGGPKLTSTGKKETIGGYETEEFVFQGPQFKASFWVATKYPDAAGILKEMQAPVSGAWKPSSMGMPEYTDFKGLPLKTVISAGGAEMTTTIVSIKKDPVNAAEFEIPKDFEELKRPVQPGPASGQSPAGSPSATP